MASQKKSSRKSKYAVPMATVRLVRKVEKCILEEPKRFDMGEAGNRESADEVKQNRLLPSCGTVACIAGWVSIIKLGGIKKAFTKSNDGTYYYTDYDFMDFAEKTLGLGKHGLCSADDLFYEHSWPEPFCGWFADARSKRAEAKIGVERLEHFLHTGQ